MRKLQFGSLLRGRDRDEVFFVQRQWEFSTYFGKATPEYVKVAKIIYGKLEFDTIYKTKHMIFPAILHRFGGKHGGKHVSTVLQSTLSRLGKNYELCTNYLISEIVTMACKLTP